MIHLYNVQKQVKLNCSDYPKKARKPATFRGKEAGLLGGYVRKAFRMLAIFYLLTWMAVTYILTF